MRPRATPCKYISSLFTSCRNNAKTFDIRNNVKKLDIEEGISVSESTEPYPGIGLIGYFAFVLATGETPSTILSKFLRFLCPQRQVPNEKGHKTEGLLNLEYEGVGKRPTRS